MNNLINQLKQNFVLQGLFFGSCFLLLLLLFSPSHELSRQIKIAEAFDDDMADISLPLVKEAKVEGFTDVPQNFLVSVEPGDTLADILQEKRIPKKEAVLIVQALSRHINLRKIRVGEKVSILVKFNADGVAELLRLSIAKDKVNHVEVVKTEAGQYKASPIAKEMKQVSELANIVIKGSVYLSARKHNVPSSVINQVVAAYSYDVNFQRDVKSGDSLCVFYEKNVDAKTGSAESGNLLYASLRVGSRSIPVYAYDAGSGTGFFYKDGQSVKKAFMSTPVKGARISSGFGLRIHPISGHKKFHQGVDFAANTGTSVVAAADGKVVRSSWYGGYGHCIEVKHANGYSTLYGHLSAYANGVRPGANVYQGKTIGFVGSTGSSTGPHLHFELRKQGVPINPRQKGLHTTTFALQAKDLSNFKRYTKDIDDQVSAQLSKKDL